MGIVTVESTDRLYWLGRYSERVYTTVLLFGESYDKMIELQDSYKDYCVKMEIPDIYTDGQDFLDRYCFDPNDVNSIYANLLRAQDNAIELREVIGSEAQAYIQMAIYEMQKAAKSEAPMLQFMKVRDHILAFWGITDDMIASQNVRNIIKTGKRIERLDLYARLKFPRTELAREIHRLTARIIRTEMHFNEDKLRKLDKAIETPTPNYTEIVNLVESLFD